MEGISDWWCLLSMVVIALAVIAGILIAIFMEWMNRIGQRRHEEKMKEIYRGGNDED